MDPEEESPTMPTRDTNTDKQMFAPQLHLSSDLNDKSSASLVVINNSISDELD
jgi:hypothetical protein